LCNIAATAGFSVTVVDDREDFADQSLLPAASRVVCSDYRELFDKIQVTASTCIVCATSGHAHDYTVISRALNTEAAYIGLVGSRSKRATFFRRLQQENGVSEADLARIYTPVGLNIGAVSPAEIAVSITAQLIEVRNTNGVHTSNDPAGSRGIPAYGQDKTAAAAE